MVFYYDTDAENGVDFSSSSIDAIYYDRKDKRLGVEFTYGATVYEYLDVEESTFNAFVNATSVGKFYVDYIKGRYTLDRRYTGAVYREETQTIDHSDANAFTGQDGSFVVQNNGNLSVAISNAPASSKFGVKWSGSVNGSDVRIGPFEFLTEAFDANDAIAKFHATAATLHGDDLVAKIVSVTLYFE